MRTKMIESDCVDAIIGLGANLFYNSPMEACLLICRMNKPKDRKGKILFINAVDEVKQEKTTSYLEENHIRKIFAAYKEYKDIPGFARIVSNEEILRNNATLSIPIYVSRNQAKPDETVSLQSAIVQWETGAETLQQSLTELFKTLEVK
jgi:type I restriction enzyme M protein